MIERLKKILNANKDVAAWKIELRKREASELYFVRKNLETSRAVNVLSYDVTVYVDQDGKRGASSFSAYEYMSDEEIAEKIKENLYAASFAMNLYYELPKAEGCCDGESKADGGEGECCDEAAGGEGKCCEGGNEADGDAGKCCAEAAGSEDKCCAEAAGSEDKCCTGVSDKGADKLTLSETAELISDAVLSADCYDNGYLAATEVFVNRNTLRIVNSNGVDVSDTSYMNMVELIPTWVNGPEDEVEIYDQLRFQEPDAAKLKADTDENLMLAKARAEAKPLSEVLAAETVAAEMVSDTTGAEAVATDAVSDTTGNSKGLRVILQDSEVSQIFSQYFAADLNYAAKYTHSNRNELGDMVQGDNVTGNKLTLKAVPFYKGACRSAAFDADGVVLKEKLLIEDGKAVGRFGNFRYGYYLGETEPAGSIPVLVVNEGVKSFAEMAEAPYLRCVRLSGLQVDGNSGYFGGEVRLGFYFDGEKEIPVTGFTVSGDMKQSRGTMIYSKETVTLGGYHGPKYLEIPDMQIM